MPEAIATTKRKFYKALDSFTTSSQVSLSAPSAKTTDSIKHVLTATEAFDEARERARKRLRHSVSSGSFSPLPVQVPPPRSTANEQSKPRETPNFAPWSHDAFLARLKTFRSASLWHSKPDPINEVAWAKRGWVCVGTNTVSCKGGCENRVVISLESPSKEITLDDKQDLDNEDESREVAFRQALTKRYEDRIIDGHSQNCLWRKSGCKDDIYHLQVVKPAIWQPQLRQRYRSILKIGDAVRSIKLQVLELTDPAITSPLILLNMLPHELVSTEDREPDESLLSTALSISLHGWHGCTESGSQLFQCEACFQRVGLWMYQPGYQSHLAAENDDGLYEQPIIDLLEMHREHCPWRNSLTQKASGRLSEMNATQVLCQVATIYAREYKRQLDKHVPSQKGTEEHESGLEEDESRFPVLSKEEIMRQDKERESKLRKLKNLFSIKRRSMKIAPRQS